MSNPIQILFLRFSSFGFLSLKMIRTYNGIVFEGITNAAERETDAKWGLFAYSLNLASPYSPSSSKIRPYR